LTDGEALEYATILINFAKLMIRLSKNKN
jgi:hypothetical protein